MKEIISHGNKTRMICTCRFCNCKFSYEMEDICMAPTVTTSIIYNYNYAYVQCPECGAYNWITNPYNIMATSINPEWIVRKEDLPTCDTTSS